MPLETIVVNEENQFDIFIIGSGPAGLTAALYGARSGLKTGFIDKSTPGGKLVSIKSIQNFPGYENVSGSVLAEKMYSQAIDAGAKYIYGTITNIVEKLGMWCIYGEDGKTWFSNSIIIASGTDNTKLNVPGEKEYQGSGISYCVSCDGPLTTQKNAVVVGNNAEAYSSALQLSKIAKSVSIISDKELSNELNIDLLKQNNIKLFINEKIVEIAGDSFNVNSIILQNTVDNTIKKLDTDFVFINTGYSPSIDFAELLGITENGIVKVDDEMTTSAKGIFAAGDVCKNENRQIVTACADGSIAAMKAIKFVNENKK